VDQALAPFGPTANPVRRSHQTRQRPENPTREKIVMTRLITFAAILVVAAVLAVLLEFKRPTVLGTAAR
jgi:hypothetical protein